MKVEEPYVNPKVKLKIIEDYVLHYNINRLYSYGDIISTFILIGGRGIGKSTGLGIKCIKNFRNKGEECAIIKRYVDETKEIKDYFDKEEENGFEFAYVKPGMNRVIQAVGRVIRSENDVGAVLLIDNRYLQARYRDLFKSEWDNYEVVLNVNDVKESLEKFYAHKIIEKNNK